MIKFSRKNTTGGIRENKRRGFTLVETLVSISIFSIAILGLLTVLSQGVNATSYAKQKMAGTSLAQEGIEYMRNLRDTFVLYDAADPQTGWTKFKNYLTSATAKCDNATNGCYFDSTNLNYASDAQPITSLTLLACNDSNCSGHHLLYDSATGKYGYAAGTDSGFTRKITMVNHSANEIWIYSSVTWTQGTGLHAITLSEHLFSWAPVSISSSTSSPAPVGPFADFESDTSGSCPVGWTCTGDAMVADTSNGHGCTVPSNISGTHYLKAGCDNTTGSAQSPSFILPAGIDHVSVLRAGGADAAGQTGWFVVDSVAAGRFGIGPSSIICSAQNGTDTNTFFTDTCDLRGYAGQRMFIYIADNEVGTPWGSVYVDNIRLMDASNNMLAPQ